MFKHTVEYKDFNGNERKDDLYFHLSLPELTRLEAEIGMPLEDHIKQLSTNNNTEDLLKFLEKMMLSSYGQKTLDGKSFRKSKDMREEFEYSNAYAELFEQMMTDKTLAQRFGENVAETGKVRKNQLTPQVVSDNTPSQ